MVLHGSGMSNGNLHDHKNLPLVLVGGGAGRLRGGRHIKFPELTPMANLLLGLLDKAGCPPTASATAPAASTSSRCR